MSVYCVWSLLVDESTSTVLMLDSKRYKSLSNVVVLKTFLTFLGNMSVTM